MKEIKEISGRGFWTNKLAILRKSEFVIPLTILFGIFLLLLVSAYENNSDNSSILDGLNDSNLSANMSGVCNSSDINVTGNFSIGLNQTLGDGNLTLNSTGDNQTIIDINSSIVNQSESNNSNSSKNAVGMQEQSLNYTTSSQINPATETGLVALYHFNNQSAYGENATKIYDFSGNGNNGTVYGGAVWNSTGGIIGTGAFQFDGSSGYIETQNNLPFSGDAMRTVSLWLNANSIPSANYVTVYSSGTTGCQGSDLLKNFGIELGYSNKVYFHVNGNLEGVPAGGKLGYLGNITLNSWNHVVIVYNGTDMLGYLNGVYTFNDTRALSTTNSTLRLGKSLLSCTTTYFNGSIDEVAIYNRSLSAAEVAALYTLTSRPALYWVGASNGNWSNPASWASSSGGTGGVGVPNSTSEIIFDSANSNNAVIDPGFAGAIYSLNVSNGYRGTISFWTNSSLDVNITNNFYLGNSSSLVPTYSSLTGNGTGRVINVGGNATIVGIIDANSQGFPTGLGPGYTGRYAGASHGGVGHGGPGTYGSYNQPTSLGSGSQDGVAGAGAIKLNVSGILNVTGTIRAIGGAGGCSGGSGSGGSIWLIANTFTGNGTIDASGVRGSCDASGGGRVALEYGSSSFIGNVEIKGITGVTYNSQPGTLWEPGRFAHSGNIVLNNQKYQYFFNDSTPYSWNLTLSNYSLIYFHGGNMTVDNLVVLNSTLRFDVNSGGSVLQKGINNLTITNSINVTSSPYSSSAGAYFTEGNMNFNSVTVANTTLYFYIMTLPSAFNLTILGNSTLVLPAQSYNFNSFNLPVGSILYPLGNTTAINTESGGTAGSPHGSGVTMNINGNASVLGIIDGNSQGFTSGTGPGTAGGYAGAGYGGNGYGGGTYGSITKPSALGSSPNGGGWGGGAIKLNVSGILNVSGTIRAVGGAGRCWPGSGSGGSIWLIANTFVGNGFVNASGIRGSCDASGGGRVAFEYGASSFTGYVDVNGMTGSYNTQPGTYFFCTSSYRGACSDAVGYGGISLATGFTLSSNGINITRGINSWSTDLIKFNDSSSNSSNIAFYNISSLNASTAYYIFDNEVLQQVKTTNASGALSFNVTLNGTRSIELETGVETFYWVGATNALWSNASSWANSSGGAGGAGVPRASDAVVFDPMDLNNSIIDVNFSGAVYSLNFSIGYNGTVSSSLGWNKSLNVTTNLLINNGTLTHTANTNAQTYRLNINVVNLTVNAGGVIDVTGKGYSSSPYGCGGLGCGGTYGGVGGNSGWGSVSYATTYGSITAPVSLGSNGAGPPGGGAIILNVSGLLTVQGSILSNGFSATYAANDGDPSGGSIFITTNNISGSGLVTANGGSRSHWYAGGGGGGRVAVFTSGSDFGNINYTATGGVEWGSGSAGTVYLKKSSDSYGELIINNNGVSSSKTTLVSDVLTDIPTTAKLTIKNYGILEIGNNVTFAPLVGYTVLNSSAQILISANGSLNMTNRILSINASSSVIVSAGATLNITNGELNGDTNGLLRLNGGALYTSNDFNYTNVNLWLSNSSSIFNPVSSFTIGSGALFTADTMAGHTFSGNVIIKSGGNITHSANAGSEVYKLNLTILGNLTINNGGVIDVTGKGYSSSPYGCGGLGCGGTYGGVGGNSGWGSVSYATTYGSITAPVSLGSNGAGPAGGGAIILNVSGVVVVNGSILSNGFSATYAANDGDPSGGSIFITTNNISGSGLVTANGGSRSHWYAGGGGGGRVAVILTNSSVFGNINYTATGGVEWGSGSAGTVYLKKSSDSYGELIIDNNGISSAKTTLIYENLNGTLVGNVQIRNYGSLNVAANGAGGVPTLTVYGNWNRTGTGIFSAGINSTIIFTGTGNSTIYSNETFYNLNITKTGGSVFFPAGWRMNVSGNFNVVGNATGLSYLRSASNGTQWKINVSITSSVNYADVKDSNNTGTVIYAYNSTSSGNNFGWDLSSPNMTNVSPNNNFYSNSTFNNFTANLSDDYGIKNATFNIQRTDMADSWLSFDGVNDWVDIGNSSLLNFQSGNFTVSAWIKTSATTEQAIIEKNTGGNNRYAIVVDVGANVGKIHFYSRSTADNSLRSSIAVNDGAWHYIVVERGANKIFIDGINRTGAGSVDVGDITSSINNFTIGLNPTYTDAFNGSIDEVRIYNRTLNSSEIGTLYSRGRNGNVTAVNSSGLVAYYDFNEGSGSVLIDRSGNGNNGTINGATWKNVDSYTTNFASGVVGVVVGTVNTLFDGIYRWWWSLFDWAGNQYTTANRTLTVDTSVPVVNFTSPTPTDGDGANGAFFANATISDLYLSNITWNWNNVNYTFGSNYSIVPPANFSNGLVLMMNFDNETSYGENATKVVDFSGMGNNGTIVGGASWNSSGKYGGGMTFDGSSGYVNVTNGFTNLLKGNDNHTVSFWFNAHSFGDKVLISGPDTYYLQFNNSTGMYVQVGATYRLYTVNTLTAENWYHLTFVKTGGGNNGNLYINGILQSSYAGAFGSTPDTNSSINIGRYITSNYNFNGSIDEVRIWNRSLSANEISLLYQSQLKKYGSDIYYNTNLSASSTMQVRGVDGVNWQVLVNQTGLGIGQTYNYSLFGTDLAGNIGTSGMRRVLGNTIPILRSILLTPNDTDSVDPGMILSIRVNITDSTDNFESAKFQWKNLTDVDWRNISLVNVSGGSSAMILNASWTLPGYESNLTYRVWMKDAAEVTNSSSYILPSFWDCTWTATSSLGPTAGWQIVKSIGNITINNTGDSQYGTNNCNLSFRLNHDLTNGRIYFDGSGLRPSNSYLVTPKTSIEVSASAQFLTEIKSEGAVISINDVSGNLGAGISQFVSRNVTATLISNQNGPYLYEQLTQSPGSVYLTAGSFAIQGYLVNVMGSPTINENNTAYNVSFYWSLPGGITNLSGDLATSYDNITDNSNYYSDVNVTFSNIESMGPGLNRIYLYAQGFNRAGDLIVDANNNSLLTESVNVSFVCYNVSDGVYVTACGSADGDYVAPITEITTESASGGGGGGGAGAGGGGGSKFITESSRFELTRGKQNSFTVEFRNPFAVGEIKDLRINLTGLLSEYIIVSPSSLDSLSAGETLKITSEITAPKYFNEGKYNLTMIITGTQTANQSTSEVNERKVITLYIFDISSAEGLKYIDNSAKYLADMKSKNWSVREVEGLLNDMRVAYNSTSLDIVNAKYNQLKGLYDKAVQSDLLIKALREEMNNSKLDGISTPETNKLVNLAESAFLRGDYNLAMDRLKEAQLSFAIETKGEFSLVYYVKRHPTNSAGIVLATLVFLTGTSLLVRKRLLKSKLKLLGEEETLLLGLMKVIQKQCFEDAKMSMDEYQTAMAQYESRLNSVIQDKIETQSKLLNLMRIRGGRRKALNEEALRLKDLIRETQKMYFEQNKIETRVYNNMMKSYASKLSEIEEKIATLEAREALSKAGFRGGIKI